MERIFIEETNDFQFGEEKVKAKFEIFFKENKGFEVLKTIVDLSGKEIIHQYPTAHVVVKKKGFGYFEAYRFNEQIDLLTFCNLVELFDLKFSSKESDFLWGVFINIFRRSVRDDVKILSEMIEMRKNKISIIEIKTFNKFA